MVYIIPPYQTIQSLWNSFKRIIFELKLYFRWDIVIKSNDLGLFRLRNSRLIRFELINYLSDKGYSNREILDFLIISNINKVRISDIYKLKDVWVGLKKYNQRLKRINYL